MAFQAFLQVASIDGDSQDTKHPKWIEILSLSIGAMQDGGSVGPDGLAPGSVNVSDLSVIKHVDSASPLLFQYCCSGQKIDKIQIQVCAANKDQTVYLQYDLTDCVVSSKQLSGNSKGDDDRPIESVSFKFTTITETYTPWSGSGGSAIPGKWNLATNDPNV